MRALVMTAPSQGPDRTEVRDVEAPCPGTGEVTIDVAHAGINFIDVMARRGDAGYASWPFAPGKEVAGTVREVGAGVTGLTSGQRVAAFLPGAGGLAEVALAPAALTVPVPDEVPSAVAAAAPLMLATALLLLTDAARFSPGETVLVHSASGGVGGAVAQLVPVLGGGRLVGTVGRADKIPTALKSGYDAAVPRDGDLAEAVRAAADGGVDVILDPLGTALLDADVEVINPGGRVVLFGNAGGGQAAALPGLDRLRAGNIAISGFSISALAVTAPERVAVALRRVLDLIAEGRLDVPVTELGSLSEVPAAHQLLADGRGTGKYVARIGPAES
ncbi:zinc-binding dehydrogenase [Actinoallomurus sp. NPDC050550]|uniref:quinone oxidoreductase family protein n=1 Tax=Actinoallomurus sp. NPDC050550 TaxID=3154937 RepID=UPI0033C5C1D2